MELVQDRIDMNAVEPSGPATRNLVGADIGLQAYIFACPFLCFTHP
jgi:hypothetical protein